VQRLCGQADVAPMSMKVLHLINTLSAGGAELHLLTLSRHLKRQGVDLVVACLREYVRESWSLRSDFEKENIEVINLNADSRYNMSFLNRLVPLVKRQRPDILHTHLPRADIAGAFISPLVKSSAFLCSVHGIYRDRWFGTWAAPVMRRAYRKADAIIAISSAVKEWLHRDLRICDGKIRVIHYGIEPDRFTRDSTGRSKSGQVRHRPVVGSIGRIEPGKNFECLIRAMKSVHNQVPNVSLLVAGHDPLGYGKKLEELIAELDLTEHVRLIGFQKDVASFLHDVDIFAFASRSEGFGQVAIEAMAAGRPVVVSKIPPLTEIVKDRETGLLVDPDDPPGFAKAILWLLDHPEQAQQIARHGQEVVYSHFAARRMVNETIIVYKELMNPGTTAKTRRNDPKKLEVVSDPM
jgi:L-malate glycosyltransferase